ncbi:MAG: sulfatase [Verrucomicrobiales bacterium]|nr:sulfatase [Verrucomicrobiales bacterium]|tara:strand:+ start:9772 stop:11193 length:1422 start_codon:yes stop_codon:yes gene_type:complete
MNSFDFSNSVNRRTFLGQAGLSIGSAALAGIASEGHATGIAPGRRDTPHLFGRAKRVIFLCMAGGPSHLETFDYKPELNRMNGSPMPESYTKGQPIAQLQGAKLKVQGHLTKFGRYGQGGQYIADFLPWHREIADDIAVIRSMVTEQINHDPAHTFMNTGTAISGRPSMGSWINYGLGSESSDLPGFVVLSSTGGRNPQPISQRQWGSGFLPSRYQGVQFNSSGDPVYYVRNPRGVSTGEQRRVVDAVNALNRHRNKIVLDPEIDTRISAYEMAFRMQMSVPELMDVSDEPKHILDMYGAKPGDGSFASNCLLARRLAERGSRFIHLYHRGWDHHGGLIGYMRTCCGLTDQPAAALIKDLKQRGMLDETLIIWGGEFGRTPMFQGKGGAGRDHHIKGFSMWMAGGGIKGGHSYGNTDDLGYHSVENVVHVRDLHATMLHLLGLDHKKFSVKYQGLNMRLTGVEKARVIKDILA